MTAIGLALQDRFAPGHTLRGRYETARRFGFDALEISIDPLQSSREAVAARVPVAAISGGYRGWLIDPDPAERRAAREDLAELLVIAGELGCGCVVVPIWGRTRHLPNIGTGRSREEDEALFVDALQGLAVVAERAGSRLFVEPLNRYQNDVCLTIADALRLRDRVAVDAVMVMGDVFHMNIEEADLEAALVAAGPRLGHVHLADNQRTEPGTGHLDFGPVFRALKRIAYAGYLSFELARLSGEASVVLPRSVTYVRERMRGAALV